jgi:hypothetical protein
MCSAQSNARDVCKIKMIMDRGRIGSTLPKLIGVGVETTRRDFFRSEDLKAFCGIGMVGPMTAIASRQEKPIRYRTVTGGPSVTSRPIRRGAVWSW